ncbi:MAG: Rieske 2Fe-2S domain-containing protein [Actinobacteria bacterium]|nr:Rieske 2Fe-2S domain-containing protein [Actinomycetota bacterium]
MDAQTTFIIGIALVTLLVVAAVLSVALNRGPSAGPVTGSFDRRAAKAERAARKAAARARAAASTDETGSATVVLAETPEDTEPIPDPLMERETISAEEYGVNRRMFFNRAILGFFGASLGFFGLASLAFLWPKLKGGFGTPVSAGNIDDLRAEVIQSDGTIKPKPIPAAQAWIVPFRGDVSKSILADVADTVIVGAGAEPGIMAIWHRCPHLGCRVPECLPSQGFECPCHGSKYNFHGEYIEGPAPRNMDRFRVTIDAENNLIIDTGTIIETSRAPVKSVAYPQGPSCL